MSLYLIFLLGVVAGGLGHCAWCCLHPDPTVTGTDYEHDEHEEASI